MFKTKEEILKELSGTGISKESLCKELVDILTGDLADEEYKQKLIRLYNKVSNDEETWHKSAYTHMIADLLSVYRRDSYCMDYVEKMYKAIDLSYPERYFAGLENLGLLYMDEKCTLYNVEKAAPTLMMVFQAGAKTGGVNLNHPDVLFAYATALTYCTNFIARGMSDTYFDKAAEAGHPKAIRIREEKRRNNKLCLFCGGKFKGLFVKKCSVCGEKKNY